MRWGAGAAKQKEVSVFEGGEVSEPLRSGPSEIDPAWIDYNGHLNMAYYLVLFDRGIDSLMARVGLVPRADGDATLFAAETQLRYLSELRQDARVVCHTTVLRVDGKRLHTWQEVRDRDGPVAATCENLHLCVRRTVEGPRVGTFPAEVRPALDGLVHRGPWPEGAGSPVARRGFGAPGS